MLDKTHRFRSGEQPALDLRQFLTSERLILNHQKAKMKSMLKYMKSNILRCLYSKKREVSAFQPEDIFRCP